MEQKSVELSVEEAKKLYSSGDSTLKDIALRAYPKSVLDENSPEMIIEEMCQSPEIYSLTSRNISELEYIKNNLCILDENPMIFLRILGLYLNKGWTRELGKKGSNSGWFLTKRLQKPLPDYQYPGLKLVWAVASHASVYYPGIVYFKTLQDAEKAMEILGTIRLDKLYNKEIL